MPARVVDDKHISINSRLYRTARPVQFFLANQQPGKVDTGDLGEESNPLASTWTINDLTGGIGVEFMDPKRPNHLDRAWYATAWLRHHGQIVLPRRAIATTQATAADISVLAAFQSEVYVTHTTTVYLYNNTNDTWSSVRTLLNNATDWAVGLVGGTETLVIATGSEVDYATNSSTWNRQSGQAIRYVVFWKDLLWGITNAGALFYTDSLAGAWTADATLQLPSGYIRKLVVARGPDKKDHIYASTQVGLYVHDDERSRFVKTDFTDLPFHPDGGKGATVWRGQIAYPAGNGLYRFEAGADRTIVEPVGPDRDHGLPSDRRGTIIQLEGSHNELIAALDASTGTGVSNIGTRSSGGHGSHRWGTFGARTGYSLVLGWDTRGWQVLWQSGASARPVNALLVTNAYSTYRLWWAANQLVYYMALPIDVINPLQVSTTQYEASGEIETPWFDAGVANQNKLALSVVVETNNPTSSETVQIEYATNYSTSYTSMGTISTSGETRYYFGTNRAGTQFRAIKFRISLARGSTNTNTPTLRRLSLSYRKRIRVLYGVEATLDLSEEANGINPKDQMTNLRSAVNNGTLVEVTWRDDTGDTQNYYMDFIDLRSLERSGRDHKSLVLTRFIEPEQSTSR